MKKLYLLLLSAIAVTPAIHALEPSGSLPVLVIDTENHQEIYSKEVYINATYYLDPRGIDGVEAFGSADNPLPLQIKGRGNYTWTFNKKPYRIKLDKKAALLGMESSKHFALMAHADDSRAFMRNLTGFEVSRMSGLPWTPADQPCEVILNGDYIGLYFLTETIRFDKKRINLSNPDDDIEAWLEANADKTYEDYPFTDEDYTGAWLIEFDNNKDPNQVVVPCLKSEGSELWITYKTPEDYVTDAHRQWLYDEIAAIDAMIYAEDHAEGAWTDKIDITDAARFFVVNQIMNNYESYSGSCYLYKDKGAAEKWHFGPVWDFGSSFQVSRDVTKWIWDSQYPQYWIRNMWDYPEFQNEVKRIFVEMDTEGFNRIFDYQNDYAARITEAAYRDAERWHDDGYGNPDMATPLAEVQDQLRLAINSFGYNLGVDGYEAPPVSIYLRGDDISNWEAVNNYKFTPLEDGSYRLDVAQLSGQFKIADSTWNEVDLGSTNSDKITLDTPYQLTVKGGNLTLADGSAENVTLLLDIVNGLLTVTNQSGVQLVVMQADDAKTEYYNLQGIQITAPQPGEIYIIKTSGKTAKAIYR